MDKQIHAQYEKLDFDTVVTTAKYDTIKVTVDPTIMVDDYAKAVAQDLERRNPSRYATINEQLGDEIDLANAIQSYIRGLLAIRIEMVNDECKVWRQAKTLMIPPYVQFVLSQIGECLDYDRGLLLLPECNLEYDIVEMSSLSKKLEAFTSDGIVLLKDAFPRDKQGDKDTMSFAIIGDYVMSMQKSHPAKSYVCAFIGMKLKEESELKALYRVRYDELNYIKMRLLDVVASW